VPLYAQTHTGVHQIGPRFGGRRAGVHRLGPLYGQTPTGVHALAERFAQTRSGLHRIEDTSLDRYELFVGSGSAPDLDGTPDETFSALPHTTTLTLPVSTVSHLVLRRRNRYNLTSLNTTATLIETDGAGDEVATPPTAPSFQAVSESGGAVAITAQYGYAADGTDQADAWLVWHKLGTDPVPGTDTPTEVAMVKSDGIARLAVSLGSYTDGQDVRVLVRTRRSAAPDVDSPNTTALQLTYDTDGPATPRAVATGGAGSRGLIPETTP